MLAAEAPIAPAVKKGNIELRDCTLKPLGHLAVLLGARRAGMGASLAFDQEALSMTTAPTFMCRYHYDALDLLTGLECADQASLQRFYRHQHLVTERQAQASQSVFQYGEQLLAVQSSVNDTLKSRLLATDQQRSVLQLIDSVGSLPKVYTPYGYHRAESGLNSLLGFNGERRDPVTGCYLLGNGRRGFNPVLMRFNSPDRLSPFGQGGLNSYAYCLGDPVSFSDPTGSFAEIGRLITSILGVSNTRLGMSRAIPSYNLAKDSLRFGALRQLPARQAFGAVSTVAASGAILTTGLVGVASAVVAIVEDPEAAAILGYVALGLTTLAIGSRVGTYWAMNKPGTEAALMSFVKNKGQVITATAPASSRSSSVSFEASAPPQTPGTFRSDPVTVGGKRSYDEMIGVELDRPFLKARRQRDPLNSNKKIRRA